MQKHMLVPALALSALVGQAASAEVIAQYNFEEFTASAAAWPANNGPYQNTASSTLGTASTLSNVGLGALEALAERATETALPSYAALIGPGNMTTVNDTTPPATSEDDYFGFTFTTSAPTNLSTFTFDYGVSTKAAHATLGHDTAAQLYYSIDGGAFSAIGDRQTRAIGVNEAGFTGMLGSSINLSSLSELAVGQVIEFRLNVLNNRGYASSNGAVYVDNLVLNAVPEPASLALLGLGGLAIVGRRRA